MLAVPGCLFIKPIFIIKLHPGTTSRDTHKQTHPHPPPPEIKMKENPARPLGPSLGAHSLIRIQQTSSLHLRPPSMEMTVDLVREVADGLQAYHLSMAKQVKWLGPRAA